MFVLFKTTRYKGTVMPRYSESQLIQFFDNLDYKPLPDDERDVIAGIAALEQNRQIALLQQETSTDEVQAFSLAAYFFSLSGAQKLLEIVHQFPQEIQTALFTQKSKELEANVVMIAAQDKVPSVIPLLKMMRQFAPEDVAPILSSCSKHANRNALFYLLFGLKYTKEAEKQLAAMLTLIETVSVTSQTIIFSQFMQSIKSQKGERSVWENIQEGNIDHLLYKKVEEQILKLPLTSVVDIFLSANVENLPVMNLLKAKFSEETLFDIIKVYHDKWCDSSSRPDEKKLAALRQGIFARLIYHDSLIVFSDLDHATAHLSHGSESNRLQVWAREALALIFLEKIDKLSDRQPEAQDDIVAVFEQTSQKSSDLNYIRNASHVFYSLYQQLPKTDRSPELVKLAQSIQSQLQVIATKQNNPEAWMALALIAYAETRSEQQENCLKNLKTSFVQRFFGGGPEKRALLLAQPIMPKADHRLSERTIQLNSFITSFQDDIRQMQGISLESDSVLSFGGVNIDEDESDVRKKPKDTPRN